MSRKQRIFPTAIFIACEGQSTEPNYFQAIQEEVEDNGLLVITVYPDNKEKNNRTDPMGLIIECQKRLTQGFDEVWAVYDKNGYLKHKEVLDAANTPISGKTVNIAFSSISFEVWILLHFEKSITAFVKSDCKDATDHYINCGSNINPGDCNGARCVAGQLRVKNYFPDYSKKKLINIYRYLKPYTYNAIINAAWLEKNLTQGADFYDQNPYTTVDKLIKRLFDIHDEYSWGVIQTESIIQKISFLLSIQNTNLVITIKNQRETLLVFNEFKLSMVNLAGLIQNIEVANQALLIDETKQISVNILPDTKFVIIQMGILHTYFEL